MSPDDLVLIMKLGLCGVDRQNDLKGFQQCMLVL